MSKKDCNSTFASFSKATGKIPYNMLNDYMFRIVLQDNKEALANIIAAVLHVDVSTITDIHVKNSIIPGAAVDNKEYHMDISLTFNKKTNVNIELQIRDEGNWNYRGIHYLCREFEELVKKGDDYGDEHSAYQIGFLDFDLFKDHVKFFSRYEMCDTEDGYKINSNFALYVIQLNRLEIATETDRNTGLDKWCRLFKAQTYEELKKMAKEDAVMEAVAENIYESNSDFAVRRRCEDREEYLRHQEYIKREMERMNAVIEKQNESLAQKDESLARKNEELIQKDALIASLQKQLDELTK